MRGLTLEERRILMPGPEGEWGSDLVIQQLIADRRASWVRNDLSDLDQSFSLTVTYYGQLALQVCPLE